MSQKDSIQDLLNYLFSLHRFGIKPGLDRIQFLLSFLENPETLYPCIHVAGTNGKGSVCSILASILQSAGYRTGLYTSPHIRLFNERIRINGECIPNEDIARLASKLMPEIEKEHTTFFEVTTAMAFAWFAEQNVDIAIIETGMGGRLDATNVIESPLATIITSIDLDHTEYLGSDLLSIASEKAGIMKIGSPVIIGESRIELLSFFKSFAIHKQASSCIIIDEKSAVYSVLYNRDLSMHIDLSIGNQKYVEVKSERAGLHQIRNIQTALLALHEISELFPCDELSIRKGIEFTSLISGIHGRIQLLQTNPPVIIDVGHNPACIKRLLETIDMCGYSHNKWQIVFGAMADKPIQEMIRLFAPYCDVLLACSPNIERAMPASQLALLSKDFIQDTEYFQSVAEAVYQGIDSKKPLLITGSFYLAEEAFRALDTIQFT
ncbi:bifunctional folylpolyglutamate synthase/dihydrofolate synthase [Chlorobiota bacterium]|nr:bifunctional folylpolyglutamate synthase/dihydrofolate synthase [Chlorobiota bacterium]